MAGLCEWPCSVYLLIPVYRRWMQVAGWPERRLEWSLMLRLRGAVPFLLAAVLFLIVNRGAYRGYFQDDEMDNLENMRHVSVATFLTGLASPRFQANNFRPAGHAYFALMEGNFGLDFPKYIAVIHGLHLLNCLLVWILGRRLGLGWWAAGAGALLFSFHMAVFDVYWKPMYVFDLLCATFCLIALLLYMRGWWLWSLGAFWLAYKSKELAIMLPLVLLVWEAWFGERRWKRLIPFFAVSLLFGVQAMLFNPNVDNDYTLRFTPAALWKSLRYYASQLLLLPYAGFGLALLALVKDRKLRFGLAAMSLFFVPLLFLPGRLYAAYCYVPLVGLALGAGALAGRYHPAFTAAFFVLWLPWNVALLKAKRRQALAIADENRTYIQSVAAYMRHAPKLDMAIYVGRPAAFAPWGAEATLRYFSHSGLRVCAEDAPCAVEAEKARSVALFGWDAVKRNVLITVRTPEHPDAAYLAMNTATPLWQLLSGWYRLEGQFRWTEPAARARLERPAGAREFELVVNAGPGQIRELGKVTVEVLLDGVEVGREELTTPGWQKARWRLPEGKPGPVLVELRAGREYRPAGDPRRLGAAVVSFGFVPEAEPRR